MKTLGQAVDGIVAQSDGHTSFTLAVRDEKKSLIYEFVSSPAGPVFTSVTYHPRGDPFAQGLVDLGWLDKELNKEIKLVFKNGLLVGTE